MKILLLAITVSLSGCLNSKNIDDGFWYGKSNTDDFDYPVLYKVDGNNLIDYYGSPDDTLHIEKDGDKFLIKGIDKYKTFYLKLHEDKIEFYENNNTSPLFYLKKAQSSSFLFDIPDNKDFEIDLAEGIGKQSVIGLKYRFYNAFYFFKTKNKLKISFCDTTILFTEDLLFKELITNKKLLFIQNNYYLPISLVADKNISIYDFNRALKYFRAAGYSDVSILLKEKEYEYANHIELSLPILSEEEDNRFIKKAELINSKANQEDSSDDNNEEEMFFSTEKGSSSAPLPPPPPVPDVEYFEGQEMFFISYEKGSLKLNNTAITSQDLQKQLKNKLLVNQEFDIPYYLSPDCSISDLVYIHTIFSSVSRDLWEKNSMEEFKIGYSQFKQNDWRKEYIEKKYRIHLYYIIQNKIGLFTAIAE